MPPTAATPPATKPSLLDRALQIFAPVRPGEAMTALLLAVNVFVILTGYYVLKVLREPLILLGGGAELKAYASGGQALLLLAVVPLFGLLASRVNRLRLLTVMQFIFIGCLAAFYVLAKAEAPIGLAFYLWLGVYSMLVVSNFWSFANDIYTPEQGKRLFPIVGVGGSLGAILGARVPKWFESFGIEALFLLAAGGVVASMILYRIVEARERDERDERNTVKIPKPESRQPVESDGGFRLVLKDKYLRLIAAIVVIATVVNTTGEYVISKMAEDASEAYAAKKLAEDDVGAPAPPPPAAAAEPAKAAGTPAAAPVAAAPTVSAPSVEEAREEAEEKYQEEYLGGFFSDYYSIVNLVSFLLQALFVSRIIKFIGVRNALFVLPVIAALGWIAFFAFATVRTIRITKTAENSADYSIQNTVRQALFLPTSRASKYKAKAAIDTFFVRTADAIAGLAIVPLLVSVLDVGIRAFAVINVALVLLWILIAVRTGKLHDERTEERASRAAKGLRETAL
jgi:ATP:ADP antiporter, AAA family